MKGRRFGGKVFRSPRALAVGLVTVAGLIALVWLAWPRSADSDVLLAYRQLQRSPVPVKVLGWITPSQARVQLLPDGYVLSLHADGLGDVTISGRQGVTRATQDGIMWQEGDVAYTVETSADGRLIQPRIVALEDGQKQLEGRSSDTPILYLGYLPAFVVFGVWATRSLLLGPPQP